MTIDLQYLEDLTGVETHDCKVSIPDGDDFLALTRKALDWSLWREASGHVASLGVICKIPTLYSYSANASGRRWLSRSAAARYRVSRSVASIIKGRTYISKREVLGEAITEKGKPHGWGHIYKPTKVGESWRRIRQSFGAFLTFSRLRRQHTHKAIGMTIDLQYLEDLTGTETHECKVSIPDTDEFLALTRNALG